MEKETEADRANYRERQRQIERARERGGESWRKRDRETER